MLDALRRAAGATGVGLGLVVAANRTEPPAEALALAQLAARYAGRGVVGFGLAGDEANGPAAPFTEAFAVARAAGLLSTPHAGEHAGPASVRAALDALGARRIQHGVRAVEDPDLVRRLADEGVCLDVCPTSNVQLGVVPSLEAHPLPALVQAGVAVSLNADDPVIFGSGLLDEYELAAARLRLRRRDHRGHRRRLAPRRAARRRRSAPPASRAPTTGSAAADSPDRTPWHALGPARDATVASRSRATRSCAASWTSTVPIVLSPGLVRSEPHADHASRPARCRRITPGRRTMLL